MSITMVLGYDGSESAAAALKETIARAKQRSASVVVVFGFYVTPWGGTGEGSIREAMVEVGTGAVDSAVADLEAAGIEVSWRIVEEKPADALIQVADEVGADTIVVGTVGENPISGALMGSVVLRLIQRSRIPLLVVPATEGS
jgi:nucleotide-binding universal stress UspA family protein